MKKIINLLFPALLLPVLLSGCQGKNQTLRTSVNDTQALDSDTVSLTVWGAQEDEALLAELIDGFQKKYQNEAKFNITYTPQSESDCTNALMGDLEQSADVFAFADDQLNTLVAAGALEPVEQPENIKASNLPEAVLAASVNDTLYALPLTADNGYFLYYNKQYFSETDITSFDQMLAVAASQNKKVSMEWSSGWYRARWYVYSFFGNTGLTVGLNDDGITNYCTWNDTKGPVKGYDVAKAMLGIADHPGFLSTDDAGFLEGVRNGTIIAGINGVWNARAVEEAWGSGYGASKLPSYTCAGQQIPMASFSGYKLIGVNAYSKEKEWANKLAEWIANEDNQKLRFQMRGQGPSNINAAASKEVQSSPAIAALIDQSEFSCLQRIGGNFWEPVTAFTTNILNKQTTEQNLQEQLDTMVEGIVAP